MLQEVEESTAILLPAAEQVLQELEEEARANWEERAVYHATQVTNLAGQALRPRVRTDGLGGTARSTRKSWTG